MRGHEAGQARPVWHVRRAVVGDERRARHEARDDGDGPRHPADVGGPQEHVAGVKVEDEVRIVQHLEREAAVGVHRALRASRRAGGVDHHEWVAWRHALGRSRGIGVAEHVLPRGEPVRRGAVRTDHDDELQPRQPRKRGADRCDRIDEPPAPHEPGGGDEGLRAACSEPRRDGVGAEAGEQRDDDRSEVAHREERHHGLRAVLDEEAHAVAAHDAALPQPRREGPCPLAQLRVAEAAGGPAFALGDDGGRITACRIVRPAQRRVDPVQLTALEEARERPPVGQVRVGRPRPRPDEVAPVE